MKDGKPCSRCKVCYPHYVLEWHHKNRENKLFNISLAARNNISWERIHKELEKCELLCSNCHAEVEWQGHQASWKLASV